MQRRTYPLAEHILHLEEGFRAAPYLCKKKRWTIGLGRNFQDRPFTAEEILHLGLPGRDWSARPMTIDEAKWLMRGDIAVCERDLVEILGPELWDALDEVRQAALISMHYQLGGGRWASATRKGKGFRGFANMIRAIETKAWADAGKHARDSDWWLKDTPLRAERHAAALETGNNVWRSLR